MRAIRHFLAVLLAFGAASVVTPRAASAFEADLGVLGPVGFDFTNSFRLRYITRAFGTQRSSEDIVTILNQLNAIVTRDPVTIGIRFDMAYFPNTGCSFNGEDNCVRQDYTRLEKIYGTYTHDYGFVTAGDFYAQFGRGITLSFTKADEASIDTTIRGGRAKFLFGPVSFEFLGGQTNGNNTFLLNSRDRYIRDPKDTVAGGEAKLMLDEPGIEIGVRGAHYWYDSSTVQGNDESAGVIGGSIQFFDLVGAQLYFEAAFQRHENYDPEADKGTIRDGVALYTELSRSWGAFSATVEFKHYDTFELAPPDDALRNAFIWYNAPPTLDRVDQFVGSFTDSTGGRLMLQYFIRESYTRIYANFVGYAYGEGLGEDSFSKDRGSYIIHGYAGVTQSFGDVSVDVSAGYREDRSNEDDELKRNLIHLETEVNAPLTGPHSLFFKWWHRTEKEITVFKENDFERGLATLTYAYQPYIQISGLFGYNTEFEDRPGEPTLYPAGQFDWNFYTGSTLRLFAGMVPGGVICAGGTCVNIPASERYVMQVVTRF